MKQKLKPGDMYWEATYFDCNAQVIKKYNILRYREDDIKKMKKKCKTKEEFADALRREIIWRYWSKCEWELIIEITKDNRVVLKPWVGCHDDENATIDVTDDTTFDWRGFAEKHIGEQIYKNKATVDVFHQLDYKWTEFIDYCWNFHHKWQRNKLKSYFKK